MSDPRTQTKHIDKRNIFREEDIGALSTALLSRDIATMPGPLAEEIRRFQSGCIDDLGGADNLSEAQRAILAHASAKHAIALTILNCIAKDKAHGVDKQNMVARKIIEQYTAITRAIREDLITLGLERRRPVKSLQATLDDLRSGPAADPSEAANPDGMSHRQDRGGR